MFSIYLDSQVKAKKVIAEKNEDLKIFGRRGKELAIYHSWGKIKQNPKVYISTFCYWFC